MRPILLGMCNPLSANPRHALWPDPPGCTGHRIFDMLRAARPSLTKDRYLESFTRRNLVAGREWSTAEARRAAKELKEEVGAESKVVVLGAQTWAALWPARGCLVKVEWLEFMQAPRWDGEKLVGCSKWWRLPHPSGRNPWYNAAENRERAAALLLRLMDEGGEG